MKKVIHFFFLIVALFTFTTSCNDDDDNKTTETPTTNTPPETPVTSFKFEAGNYDVSWAGHPFKAQLDKTNENTLSGIFCVNNNIENCKNIGPIVITKNGNDVIFKFNDLECKISDDRPGDFDGTGTITKDNVYELNVNGEDCVQKYENNKVVFTII